VRNLEREIASVCRKIARALVQSGSLDREVRVGASAIAKHLGIPKYRYGKAEENAQIGLATGLAWTDVGGELLATEVAVTPGKGKLTITGKLGDVMQESAQAAMSYIRSRAEALGLEKDFYAKVDIHVHVPEGAVPKDGPSAGITMATAIASALLKRPVYSDLAMTGEITLRGRVLPIGGLKEKLLAAHRGGIKRILIPSENEKDLKDIPQKILKALDVKAVEHMDEVLRNALVLEQPDEFLKGPAVFPEGGDEKPIDEPSGPAGTGEQPPQLN
jgi:ATP-dependent Lon protease